MMMLRATSKLLPQSRIAFMFSTIPLSDAKYRSMWHDINTRIVDKVSTLEFIDDIDNDSDVIKLTVDDKTIVINSHMASKQVWYSSPVSGPKKFDVDNVESNIWKDRNNDELFDTLEKDLMKLEINKF